MQAEGIRTGDRYDERNERGVIVGGWTATGDAIVKGGQVFVPIRQHDGHLDTNIYTLGEQVPLSFGAGPQPRFPEGTPEYEAYRAELKEELRKWVAHEPPYDQGI